MGSRCVTTIGASLRSAVDLLFHWLPMSILVRGVYAIGMFVPIRPLRAATRVCWQERLDRQQSRYGSQPATKTEGANCSPPRRCRTLAQRTLQLVTDTNLVVVCTEV